MNPKEIKETLDRWGISQAWLARQLGVTRATVNKWINGTTPISEEYARKTKELLGNLKEIA